MGDFKYIITVYGAAVIFDKRILHSEIGLSAVSGGFLTMWKDHQTNRMRASCFGESKSLGLKPENGRDEMLIEKMLNGE